jgi:hypothetical protein
MNSKLDNFSLICKYIWETARLSLHNHREMMEITRHEAEIRQRRSILREDPKPVTNIFSAFAALIEIAIRNRGK